MKYVNFLYKVIAIGVILFLAYLFLAAQGAFADTNEVEVIAPAVLPVSTTPSAAATSPTSPKMDIAIYDSLPDYIKAEVETKIRKRIDRESRPMVLTQWRLTMTNEWTTIGVWKPYELTGFYRVIVEGQEQ